MKKYGWLWLIIFGLALVLPFVLLLAGVSFRTAFIFAIIGSVIFCGGLAYLGRGGFGQQQDRLFWATINVAVFLSLLGNLLKRLPTVFHSVWSELWVLFLIYLVALYAAFVLVLFAEMIAERKVLLIPLFTVPLIAVLASNFIAVPFAAGLLCGILFGLLLPPYAEPKVRINIPFGWKTVFLVIAVGYLLEGIGIALETPQTIFTAITSAVLAMFAAGLVTFQLRSLKFRKEASAEL